MAIVKMKKLQLMVARSQKDSLLDELTRMGCVQVTELSELPSGLTGEGSAAVQKKSEQSAFNSALRILDLFSPEKNRLLSAKPEISQDSFMSNEGYDEELKAAEKLISLEQRLKAICGEESRVRGLIETLTPWAELDMPLQTEGTKFSSVLLGTVPVTSEPAEMQAALDEMAPEAELFTVSSDENQHYTVLVCSKSMEEQALEAVRDFGFARTGISSIEGTAAENLEDGKKTLRELAVKKAAAEAEIVSYASHRAALGLCADRAETAILRAEAEGRLFGSESTLCLSGWLIASEEERFAECAEKFDCAWETRDPLPEEYPEVPVKLKNNRITDALNMVTEMYSLPAYDGVDPNPLMAPFFILFYGLMMADMGYGLLMIIAAVVALKKIRPKEGTLSFCRLLLCCGISTFIMGALSGGFFGNAPEAIGKLIGKPEGWGVLPCLFSPMTDSMTIMIGSLVLGIIHLNTGMVINAVEKCKRHEYADAFWEEGVLWITLLGAVLMGLSALGISTGSVGRIILIIGIAGVLYGGSRGAEGIGGKLLSVFVTVYNQVTGWFGDILSYARIMALMLAGSVIAMVFNTIGGIANNLVVFVIVFLIGHSLNFALNLLGCYVHDLRLQCLEYFGKFYKSDGKPFRPIRIKSNHYDVTE